MSDKKEFGVVGLGVMGTSIARNLGSRGYDLALFNRHVAEKEEDVAQKAVAKYSEINGAAAYDDLNAFVDGIARPRKILIMVNAGPATDDVLDKLSQLLDTDDIIIDGGNANYKFTEARQQLLQDKGIHWIGSGVSGGERGALEGPAIMPGGDQQAYYEVGPYLESIAAKDKNGRPCCGYIGGGGAGHFVKTIHNGIEYAEMQLIAEVYGLLRHMMGYSTERISDIFKEWNEGTLKSYLLEISSKILTTTENDQPIIDQILDKAGNKGTGSWSTIAACEYGVPATMISAALFARYTSAYKDDRLSAAHIYPSHQPQATIKINTLKSAYECARMINHHQGIHVIHQASNQHDWQVDLNELARIWTNGCIIRSELMERITTMDLDGGLLLHNGKYAKMVKQNLAALQHVTERSIGSSQSTPCLLAAFDFMKAYAQSRSTANMIQAQRDFFGAHTYKRTDDPNGPSHHTIWE